MMSDEANNDAERDCKKIICKKVSYSRHAHFSNIENSKNKNASKEVR